MLQEPSENHNKGVNDMNRNILYTGILLGGLLAACTQEDEMIPDNGGEPGTIQFSGAVLKHKNVETRANDNEEDNGDPDPDNYDYLNASESVRIEDTFYMWQEYSDGDDASTHNYFVPYKMVEGRKGGLELDNAADEDVEPLSWQDKTFTHTFYAWTQPKDVIILPKDQVTDEPKLPQYGEQQGTSFIKENYYRTVTFSSNDDFERFVVTKKGPVSYDGIGKDVALFFDRPISKIMLKSVTHVDGDGSQTPYYSCSIEFPNLSKRARFYPFKFKRSDDDCSECLVPSADENEKGVTWEWTKDDKNNTPPLYVHPFKFGSPAESGTVSHAEEEDMVTGIEDDLGFFLLTIEDLEDQSKTKTYPGTLNHLALSELKAGEGLLLNLLVSDGGNIVGVGCTIVDWNIKDKGTISQYRKPGVYTGEDAEKLLVALRKASGDAEELEELIPDLITKEEGTDGEEIIRINFFTHVTWNGEESDRLNIPENWILDGNGYNLSYEGSFSGSGTVEDLYQNGEEYEYPSNPDSAGQEVT